MTNQKRQRRERPEAARDDIVAAVASVLEARTPGKSPTSPRTSITGPRSCPATDCCPKNREQQERSMEEVPIAEAKTRHETELLALPNVIGVGIGERAGKPVIKVFVTQKVAETELAPEERVPSSIAAYEVDVEEIGAVEAQRE
jgi:hypothetical protein